MYEVWRVLDDVGSTVCADHVMLCGVSASCPGVREEEGLGRADGQGDLPGGLASLSASVDFGVPVA